MDDLTKRMQDDFANRQRILDDIGAARMMMDNISAVRRVFPDSSLTQSVLSNFASTQGLLNDLGAARTILGINSATRGLVPNLSGMKSILGNFSSRQALLPEVATLHLAKSLEVMALAHVSLAGLSWENIGKAINVSDAIRDTLRSDFLSFSNSYFSLYQSFGQPDVSALSFSSFTFALPVVEFFNGTDLLETISVDEVEDEYVEKKQSIKDEISMQTTDALQTLLTDLDVSLVRLWQGALQSLDSDNVDRSRHFLISLRELFTQVLHKLAPDDEVCAWTTASGHFHNGKPTRQARLLFICRDINNSPFNSFFEKDIASVLASWEILNRAHEVAIPFTQKQLIAFKIRMESALRLLLVTCQSNK